MRYSADKLYVQGSSNENEIAKSAIRRWQKWNSVVKNEQHIRLFN